MALRIPKAVPEKFRENPLEEYMKEYQEEAWFESRKEFQ